MLEAVLCCLPVCLAGGCATTLENYGEVGIRYGTEITLFSRASETCDCQATSELSVSEAILPKPAEPKPE